MIRHSVIALFLTALLSAGYVCGQEPAGRQPPADYVSDGCSWFFDCNYRECCVEHDKAYFFGGTKKDRRAADNKLYKCVKSKGHGFVAKMMWVGVRFGGGAFLPTPFRWGFGKNWKPKVKAAPNVQGSPGH